MVENIFAVGLRLTKLFLNKNSCKTLFMLKQRESQTSVILLKTRTNFLYSSPQSKFNVVWKETVILDVLKQAVIISKLDVLTNARICCQRRKIL